jgi:D-alanyl-lipoteichoic acid acyltransferase DltB (MBOAT superfamily)
LSRFLRDYLYIPLGGNRHGTVARYRNIFITMLLGGLWHGAGWNFVLWGGVHGALIGAQHSWNARGLRMPSWLGWALTLLAVMFAWVLFRASNLDVAMDLYASMLGAGVPGPAVRPSQGTLLLLAAGTAIALFGPNAKQIADTMRLTPRLAVCCGVLGAAALLKQLYAGEIHEFIYFRF